MGCVDANDKDGVDLDAESVLRRCTRQHEASRGFRVDVATSPESCGDGRNIVATALGGHRARLNSEPDRETALAAQRVRTVLSTRAEKLVYVKADADVTWGEFMELVDHVWPETGVVSILTPGVESSARRNGCLEPSCNQDCAGRGGFGASHR